MTFFSDRGPDCRYADMVATENPNTLYQVIEGFSKRAIQLDASVRSAVDGFQPAFRLAILRRLFDQADAHHQITAAFTSGEVQANGFMRSNDGPKARKMVLWQDQHDSMSNLYDAANAAQKLLSNLGYTRYPPNVFRRTTTLTTEDKQAHSLLTQLRAWVGRNVPSAGVSIERVQSQSQERITSQKEKQEYTDPEKDSSQWDFAIPYLREIGKALDLIPPQGLLALGDGDAVAAGLRENTLDATYQRLRGTEIVLLQALHASAPEFIRNDPCLTYYLENGYIEESLESLDRKGDIPNKDDPNMAMQTRQELAELNWAIHLGLYAALYQGARQRIEDAVLGKIAQEYARITPGLERDDMRTSINRRYDSGPAQNAVRLDRIPDENVRHIADYMRPFSEMVYIGRDAQGQVTMTGYPDLSQYGVNPSTADSSYARACYAPLRGYDKIVTPIDAVMFRPSGSQGDSVLLPFAARQQMAGHYATALQPVFAHRTDGIWWRGLAPDKPVASVDQSVATRPHMKRKKP